MPSPRPRPLASAPGTPSSGILAFAAARSWEMAFNLTMMAVAAFAFSPVSQGYYYTFLSLASLQSLLEGGFGFVALQFMAREWGRLRLDGGGWERGPIRGEATALSRLAGLVRLCLGWHLGLAVVVFLALLAVGHAVFAQGDAVDWRGPWLALCLGVAFQTLANGLRLTIEAADRVAVALWLQLACNAAAGLAVLVRALIVGPDLYLIGLYLGGRGLAQIVVFASLLRPHAGLLRWPGPPGPRWRDEFLRQQWRIAISTTCGALMFQAFTPIVFAACGAVAAGRVGLTLQVFQAVNLLAMSWIYTAQPRIGQAYGRGAPEIARRLAGRAMRDGLLTALVLALLAMAGLGIGAWIWPPLAGRLLGPWAVAATLAGAVALQVSNVETAVVRLQAIEPFLAASVASALLIVAITLGLALSGHPDAILPAFSAALLFVLVPWNHRLYRRHGPRTLIR